MHVWLQRVKVCLLAQPPFYFLLCSTYLIGTTDRIPKAIVSSCASTERMYVS